MTTIYYVRHGQTEYNKAKLFYGAIDAPINEVGIEQAKQTGEMLKHIKFDKIYTSDMKRAKQTASYINIHNLPMTSDDRLNERTYGELEGIPEDNVPNVTQWKADGWNFKLNIQYQNGVENITHFYNRVCAALKDIVKDNEGKTILIVAHRGVGRMTKAFFDGIPKDGSVTPYQLSNAEYWKFIVK